jgi:putative ABC transport system substrate-binding protein
MLGKTAHAGQLRTRQDDARGLANRVSRRNLVIGMGRWTVFAAGLALLGGCQLVDPSAPGSSARMPRVGYLSPDSPAERALWEAFRDGLASLGYVEGRTITIDERWAPENGVAAWAELAADLVRLPLDLIVVSSNTPAALAVKSATSSLPIVAVNVADPVGSGLVASLARPGGNVTGLSNSAPGITSKYLDLLRAVTPGLRRVAMLGNPTSAAVIAQWNDFVLAAQAAGLTAQLVGVRTAEDLAPGVAGAVREGVGALHVLGGSPLGELRDEVANLALQYHLPTHSGGGKGAVSQGMLMSYNPDETTMHQRAASFVDKILKGARPGDLPIEQPTVFELFVNMKIAQALSIRIPPDVASQVTEWVQE